MLTPEQRPAGVAALKARLAAFTASDADRHGIPAAQFLAWRRAHDAVAAPVAPEAPQPAPKPVAPAVPAATLPVAPEIGAAGAQIGARLDAPTAPISAAPNVLVARHLTASVADASEPSVADAVNAAPPAPVPVSTERPRAARPPRRANGRQQVPSVSPNSVTDGIRSDAPAGSPPADLNAASRLLGALLATDRGDAALGRVLVGGVLVALGLAINVVADSSWWGFVVAPVAGATGLLAWRRIGARTSVGPRVAASADCPAGSVAKPVAEPAANVRAEVSPGGLGGIATAVSATGAGNAPSTRAEAGNGQRRSGARSQLLLAGCGVVLVVVVGLLFIQQRRGRPPEAVLRQCLAANVLPVPVRVVELQLGYGARTGRGQSVQCDAIVETTVPWKRPGGAPEAWRGADPASLSGARSDALSAGRPDASVGELPAGTRLVVSGVIVAQRIGQSWAVASPKLDFDQAVAASRSVASANTARPAAASATSPTPAPAEPPAAVPDPVTRLADRAPAVVTEPARPTATDPARERQLRAETFARWVAPGTVFAGRAESYARGETLRLSLEITDRFPVSGKLTAALRNEGGWADSRTMEGEAVVDDMAERCTVTLKTRDDQRLPGCGPLLDQQGEWNVVLTLSATGAVSATAPGWRLDLARLDAAGAAALRERLTQPATEALAAARPGSVYHGQATARGGGTSEPVVLRFTGQDDGRVDAFLESAAPDDGARRFRGEVSGNTYRVGGAALQLRSADTERVPQADPRSLLGYNGPVTLALRPAGSGFEGGNESVTLRLERATDAWLAAHKAEAAARAQASRPPANIPATATTPRPSPNPATTASAAPSAVAAANAAGGAGQGNAAAEPALPPFPTTDGAYVQAGNTWVRLPQSRAPEKATAIVRGVTGLFRGVQNLAAGVPANLNVTEVTTLVLETSEPPPTVPAGEVVIACIGTPKTDATRASVEVPLIEIGVASLVGDKRQALLKWVAPGVATLAAAQLKARIEQPQNGVAVLRTIRAVTPGTYADLRTRGEVKTHQPTGNTASACELHAKLKVKGKARPLRIDLRGSVRRGARSPRPDDADRHPCGPGRLRRYSVALPGE